MFAPGTLRTTYSGPLYATGETVRRERNDSRALAGYEGQERAYRRQTGGIGAGSRIRQYRAGIEADRRAGEQFARSQQSLAGALANDAESRFAFESSRAEELNQLRELMLDRNRIDQSFDLTLRGDRLDSQLVRRRLAAQSYQAATQRRAGFLSSLLDII